MGPSGGKRNDFESIYLLISSLLTLLFSLLHPLKKKKADWAFKSFRLMKDKNAKVVST